MNYVAKMGLIEGVGDLHGNPDRFVQPESSVIHDVGKGSPLRRIASR